MNLKRWSKIRVIALARPLVHYRMLWYIYAFDFRIQANPEAKNAAVGVPGAATSIEYEEAEALLKSVSETT